MKKVILFLMLLSLPVFIYAWGDETTIRGFTGGESSTKVKSKEKALYLDEEKNEDFGALLYEDEIFSLPCQVIYFFSGDQLKNIQIQFDPESNEKLTEENLQERFAESILGEFDLTKYMRSKYGNETASIYEANEDEFLEGSMTYYWTLDDLRIELYYYKESSFSGDSEILSFNLSYYFNNELRPLRVDDDKF